jgi:hypothetical protein
MPAVAALVLCSCSGPSYPPPPQRQFALVNEPDPPPPVFVTMEMPDASDYILSDIGRDTEGVGWRWTREHPRLRLRLPRTKGWRLRVDFGFPPANFKDTGPVTVSYVVNGNLLDRVRYTEPGDRRFEKPVPAAWLHVDEDNTVGADIEPPWIAPSDKARLGFVLHGMGFVE